MDLYHPAAHVYYSVFQLSLMRLYYFNKSDYSKRGGCGENAGTFFITKESELRNFWNLSFQALNKEIWH